MNQKIQDRKIKFSIDDDDQIFAKIPENLFLLCGFFFENLVIYIILQQIGKIYRRKPQ